MLGLQEFTLGNAFYVFFAIILFSPTPFIISELSRYHPLNDPLVL